jgi:glutathione S-transferase
VAETVPAITLFIPDFASVRLIACSPPSWTVLLALEEKRLSYATRKISIDQGEHRTQAMLARSPRGAMPVLTDGDQVVYELLAILEYLDFAYPSPPLLPADRMHRARALTRLHESAHLRAVAMDLFSWLGETPETERSAERSVAMAGALHRELTLWERSYCQGAWAAGDAPLLADLSVFPLVALVHQLGLDLVEWYPNLERFHAAMKRRPSAGATWPATWGAPLDLLA